MKNKETYKISTPIITYKRGNGQYLFNEKDFVNEIEIGQNIVIPINADTEYWQPNYKQFLESDEDLKFRYTTGKIYNLKIPDFWKKGRLGVTSQIKGIYQDVGVILAHPNLEVISKQLETPLRHPVANSGFHPIDWLNAIGIKSRIHHHDKIIKEFKGETIPTCEFVFYSHFALAEFLMLATGEYLSDLEKISKSDKNIRAEMQRRMRVVTKGKYGDSDSIELPWIIFIENQMYRVKLCIMDSFAIHGVASYKDFCESSGVKLESKTLMDKHITMMHLAYFLNPDDFDNYSLGDLFVYEALENNAENFKNIWNSLEIGNYYEPPRLTIGATVRDIFQAKICKEFGKNPENFKDEKEFKKSRTELLNSICKWGTAEYLKEFTTSTKALNAKVEGGRCRNNRPNLVNLEGCLVDIDYSSCYGEGQRNQLYAFGRPLIDSFEYPSKINKYPTLREWLKTRKWRLKKVELVPGLWSARVSTKEYWDGENVSYAELKSSQDYLASWFDFKIKEIAEMKTDSEIEDAPNDSYLEVKTGLSKIFNKQIINGLITHDFIDWLYKVCGEKQRNELLDNLYIHTAIYYPAYDRVNSAAELLEKIDNHEGTNKSNTAPRKGGSRAVNITEECTAWYAVNLGEFIIDDLLAWRKIYPKKNADGSKNPLNTLYKLCINTLYGDMVSPFFNIGNVVVGNNITARARAACYYAEKGFNGVQSITDGVAFDLNRVIQLLENRRLTGESVVNLHRLQDRDVMSMFKLKLAPLASFDKINLTWITTDEKNDKGKFLIKPQLELIKNSESEFLTPEKKEWGWTNPAHKWIDKMAMIHLQNLFDVDVLQAPTTALEITKGKDSKPIKNFIAIKGMFGFEAKAFYDDGVFHGTANYKMRGRGGDNLAMRSYENKKEHETVEFDGKEMVIKPYPDGKKPAEFFLDELTNNPSEVKRGRTFIKQGILKINDAKQHQSRWGIVGRLAGDSIEKSGLLREFSLSQFTFQSLEQFKAISKEVEANKRKYNQSYEGFFINQNGTLNFKSMVTEIDLLIGNREISLNKIFDKSRHRNRIEDINHPESKILEKVRNTLLKPNIDKDERDFFDITILSDENGKVYPVNNGKIIDEGYEYLLEPCLEATIEDMEGFEFDF